MPAKCMTNSLGATVIKASVVIPTKNGGLLFRSVLNAVLTQSTTWPFEVLIIDSGSSDGTVEFCKSVHSIRVHSIAPETFCHGTTRNLGMGMTSGKFVAFLTHDALPANPYWLANLVQVMECDEDIGGAFGRHIAYSGGNPFIARDIELHFARYASGPAVVRIENRARYDSDVRYRQELHFFSNNNSCLRRTVWEKIPFPDVDFAEDQIWAQRMLEGGYAKAYVHNAAVYHSHSFGVLEQGRRSFDESRALHRLFNYRLCPTMAHLAFQTVRTTLADWRYAAREHLLVSEIDWIIKTPLLNASKQFGFYLGEREALLPQSIVERISRDRSLLKH